MTREHNPTGWFGALSRIMNVGVLLVDPDVNLEFANDLACELLGCGNDEDLKQRWPELRRLMRLERAQLPTASKPYRLTVNLALDARLLLLRLEIYALNEEACTGYLVLLKDRRTVDVLETDLLLASQMRSLVHVYRLLAHDLKAPLNAMQLTAELLDDAPESGGAHSGGPGEARRSERRRHHVAVLKEELARLNRILQTMLDQKQPLTSVTRAFDLREIIRQIATLLTAQASRQSVELKIQLPDTATMMMGYHDRLKQALLNIAINGLEAMPHGGCLGIRLEVRDAAAAITIQDTGSGIPDELLDEIYQIYFTTKKSGSGIGLYVARLVVESHGGEILVKSEQGSGTCFDILLPLRETSSPLPTR
jgi:signal transduction histidine kinase